MTTPEIIIELKLEVVGQDTIFVPGCEPTTAFSSTTLMRWMKCKHATVKLADALAAIPGSRIEFQINNGQSNGCTRKWFVLPPIDPSCPCVGYPDYYKILRDLETVEEESPEFTSCEVNNFSSCLPRDFQTREPPPISPYSKEGNVVGVVPQLLNSPINWSEPTLSEPSNPYTSGYDVPMVG